ncbi:hypothetical protein N665_0255s0021 [Sinapis alba]|nr:hypothetical protein N665_0255s0021 [Sinapis alba]
MGNLTLKAYLDMVFKRRWMLSTSLLNFTREQEVSMEIHSSLINTLLYRGSLFPVYKTQVPMFSGRDLSEWILMFVNSYHCKKTMLRCFWIYYFSVVGFHVLFDTKFFFKKKQIAKCNNVY